MRYFTLLFICIFATSIWSQNTSSIRNFEKDFLKAQAFMETGNYELAIEHFSLAATAHDRRTNENVARDLSKAIDLLSRKIRSEQQQQNQSQDKIRTLESEMNRIQNKVDSVRNVAYAYQAWAEENQSQVTALRLATQADQQRLLNNYEDAYLLAAKALEISKHLIIQEDIEYYFLMVARDSFAKQKYSLNDASGILKILPKHRLLQTEKGLHLFGSTNDSLGTEFPAHTYHYLEDRHALLLDSLQQNFKYYDLNTNQSLSLSAAHAEELTTVKDLRVYNATLSRDNTAKIWRSDGTLFTSLKGHEGNVYDIVYLEKKHQFVSRSSDGTLRLWDKNGHQLRVLAERAYIYSLVLSPDGEFLLAGAANGDILSWETTKMNQQPNIVNIGDGAISKLDFLKNKKSEFDVLSYSSNGKLDLWNTNASKHQHTLAKSGHFTDFLVAPEKDAVICWDTQGNMAVFGVENINPWRAHQDAIVGVDYDPSTGNILTTAKDQTVKLWNQAGEQLMHWPLIQDPGQQTAFFSEDQGTIMVPFFIENSISSHSMPDEMLARVTNIPPIYSDQFMEKYDIPRK